MRATLIVLICFLLTACSGAPNSATATRVAQLSQTATPTSTITPTPSLTPTITITPTPTISPTPTLSPTPLGLIGEASCYLVRDLKHIGDGVIKVLRYSPSGTWLAAATTLGVTLYDAVTLKEAWTAQTVQAVEEIAFAEDESVVVGVDSGPRVYTWQVSDGTELSSAALEDLHEPPTAFALSQDGSTLAVPYYDDTIHVYNTSDPGQVNKIEQFLYLGEMIYRIGFSPDGNRLVTISFNGDIRIWDVPGKKMVKVIEAETNQRPESMVFAPTGSALAVNFITRTGDNKIRILDMYSLAWRQTLDGEAIAMAPDNSILSVMDGLLTLRSYSSGSPINKLPEQMTIQGRPAFSNDGKVIAVGTQEGIHIWQWDGATLVDKIPGHYYDFRSLAISSDGQFLAAGMEGGVALYRAQDLSQSQFLTTDAGNEVISSVAYSPLGDLLAGASGMQVFVWQVSDGRLLWSKDEAKPVNQLAFSPDGARLVAARSEESVTGFGGHDTSTIPVWNANDGGLIGQVYINDQIFMPGTTDLVFTPDGSSLITAQGSGDLSIWSMASFTQQYSIANEEAIGWNQVLAISPNGQYFAAGGMDRILRLFEANGKTPVLTIKALEDSVSALAFSPDGSLIAAGISSEIKMWEASTGRMQCTLKSSADIVRYIFFFPDGRNLITLANDGVIRIWGIP